MANRNRDRQSRRDQDQQRRNEEQWRERNTDDPFYSNRAWNRGDYIQGRPYGRDWGGDQDEDLNQDYNAAGRRYGKNTDANAYGLGDDFDWQGYDWDRGQDYLNRDRERGQEWNVNSFGSNYGTSRSSQRGSYDYGRDYDRDFSRDYSRDNDQEDWGYRRGRNQAGQDWRNQNQNWQDQDQIRRDRNRRTHDYGNTGSADQEQRYGRRYSERNYGQRGDQADWQQELGRSSNRQGRWQGQQWTAGMNSDFDDSGYEENRGYGEDFRRTRWDRDQGYSNYVGYESEGAFYQDLDNPYSNAYYDVNAVENWRQRELPTLWREGHSWQQDFTGMGPAGYRRSDERVMEEVCELLTEHGWIDASDVDVNVNNGIVTLDGTVPDRNMRRITEDLVDSVMGVEDVQNHLKVKGRQGSGQREQDQSRSQQNRMGEKGSNRNQEKVNQGDIHSIANTGGSESTSGVGSMSTSGATMTSSPNAMPDSTTPEMMRNINQADRSKLREGMEVIGRDGKSIGVVNEVRQNDFLMGRTLARDVYVPVDAIQSIGAQVMLSITSDELASQNWEKPNIL